MPVVGRNRCIGTQYGQFKDQRKLDKDNQIEQQRNGRYGCHSSAEAGNENGRVLAFRISLLQVVLNFIHENRIYRFFYRRNEFQHGVQL